MQDVLELRKHPLKSFSDPFDGKHGGEAAAAAVVEGVASSLHCPITKQLMTDPVFTMDGQTYERSAIEEWLKTNDTSPATGKRLPSNKRITLTLPLVLALPLSPSPGPSLSPSFNPNQASGCHPRCSSTTSARAA